MNFSGGRGYALGHLWVATVAACLLTTAGIAGAIAETADYREGVHYFPLSVKHRTHAAPSKVEVLEFFWYGCPHCQQYEPLVREWKKNNAGKVDFVVVPVVWNDITRAHARLFYAARALGILDQLHEDVYGAILFDRERLDNYDTVRRFFNKHGVSSKDFDAAWSSFLTEHAVARAERQTRLYEITGTPSLIVDGRYRIVANRSTSSRKTLAVADMLVDRKLSGQ